MRNRVIVSNILPLGYSACQVGYYRNESENECVGWPRGTYSTGGDIVSCTSCPDGTTTYKVYNLGIIDCHRGKQLTSHLVINYCHNYKC